MISLVVQIERFVDEHFPGIVECALVDAYGIRHEFFEKVPVVTTSDLRSESLYPQPGYIDCAIEEVLVYDLGRSLVRVSTETAWSIESVAGETKFMVLKEQIFPG